MVGCGTCGTSDEFLFYCEYCRGRFCEAHQAPEAHSCLVGPVETGGIENESPPSADRTDVDAPRDETPPPPATSEGAWPRGWRPSAPVLVGVVAVLVLAAAGIGFALVGPSLDTAGLPAVGGIGDDSTSPSETVNRTAVEHRLFDGLNERRNEQGMPPVTYDGDLAAIAAYHSTDMADRSYVGHVAPDGETVRDRFDGFGYECTGASELVLYTIFGRDVEVEGDTLRFETEAELADGVLELWFRSSPHRTALLTDDWAAVGVGVVVTPEGGVYVTLTAC